MTRISSFITTALPIVQRLVQGAATAVQQNPAAQQVAQNVSSFVQQVAQNAANPAPWPGAPEGNPSAAILDGLQRGANDVSGQPARVEMLQRDLERMGYLTMPPNTPYGHFGETTQRALEAFQRDNGIAPPTPSGVEAQTAAALRNPRPRPGYGPGEGGAPQETFLMAEAARFYGERLGLPTTGVTRVDDAQVQHFDRGSVVMHEDGRLELLDRTGAPMFPPADFDAVRARAGSHMLNQLDGDPDESNNNCGYASLHMVLSYLGVPGYAVQGGEDGESANYENTMTLREAGGDGTDDKGWSNAPGLYNAARGIDGVTPSVFSNVWNGERATDVARMKLAFLDGSQPTGFVVAGRPFLGWGNSGFEGDYTRVRAGDAYNGGHYVAVVGYDAARDRFLVMDPIADRPIEVSSEQLERYLEDQNVSTGEVLQLRYSAP